VNTEPSVDAFFPTMMLVHGSKFSSLMGLAAMATAGSNEISIASRNGFMVAPKKDSTTI
jgi:hypothetical protein